MIDVEKIIGEQADKMTDATDEQKQNFIKMATALTSFTNCIWGNEKPVNPPRE